MTRRPAITVSPEPLPVELAAALDEPSPEDTWLVKSIWSHLAVGFIGGPPKTGKSHLALDIATSVASGTPCLGHFPVEHPGPALVYLAEDALPAVRARIAALCAHRGLPIETLQLHVITAPTLFLDDETDQARLSMTIEHIHPRLLLLDPLVRLHRSDENSAADVAALLGFLRGLQRRYQLAIIVVHHMSKKRRRDLGQALRGSSDLHAWSDSAAYLTRRPGGVLLTLEHRSAAAPDPIALVLVPDPQGGMPHLERAPWTDHPDPSTLAPTLEVRLRDLLSSAPAPLSRIAIRSALRVNNLRLGDALVTLERSGDIDRTPSGWVSAASSPVAPRPVAPPPRDPAPPGKRQVQLQLPSPSEPVRL